MRAKSVPVTETVSEDIAIQLNDIKEDTKYLTESRSSKKKVTKRSLTMTVSSASDGLRRNSFSIVKQGLKAIKMKKNLSNSVLNINEADGEKEEGEGKIMKETEEETKKATITDIPKCHFCRVFEPNCGG